MLLFWHFKVLEAFFYKFISFQEDSTDGSKSEGSSNPNSDKTEAYDNDIQLDESFEFNDKTTKLWIQQKIIKALMHSSLDLNTKTV